MLPVCNKSSNVITFVFTVLLQVVLVFIFLVSFFFLYVQKIEEIEFSEQMGLAIDKLTEDIRNVVNGSGIGKIIEQNKEPIIKYLEKEKEKQIEENKTTILEINANNDKLILKSFVCLLGVIGVVILITLGMSVKNYCLPTWSSFKEGIISVVFIGITELVFLTFVGRRYITTDANQIRLDFYETVRDYAKEKVKT